MITEIFIERRRVDISADLSSLLTFALDDVKDFSSRQTAFSKTVVLPGTSNNNDIFGNIFDISQANDYNSLEDNVGYNFNAAKAASCLIFQDNLQTFKGTIRLLEIIKDKGIEYEVALHGELTSLNVALSSAYLEDLDFSAYDLTYNVTNIAASWDNTPGSGVYFPLIDYGTYSDLKHDWDIRTFRPALYVKEYIDKMFSEADFRYECALFSTTRFKKLIIPHNQKKLTSKGTQLLTVSASNFESLNINHGANEEIAWTSLSGTGFEFDTSGMFNPNTRIKFTSTTAQTVNIQISGVANVNIVEGVDHVYLTLQHERAGISTILDTIEINSANTSFSFSYAISLQQDDFLYLSYYSHTTSGPVDYSFFCTSASMLGSSSSAQTIDVNPGDTINLNYCIPRNVRQVDFLTSIVKLFNLYVYEDQFDERLIKIEPYVDFYSADPTNCVDWTYKLNRNSPIRIKPMSELNSKVYNFKYKDDSDYYNDLYKKRYNQTYGSYIYDSQFEFATQTSTLELIFAPTPLVGYDGEDKVYPTIFKRTGTTNPVEETIDFTIRILQSKKITSVTSWDILDDTTVLGSYTDYGYAGHFNDPDAVSDDLNFGALEECFFNLTGGDLSNTQFNNYWSAYMAEITDKDSKLLTGKFYLTPKDIFDLDFSKYVYLDGVLFRLNKISDYNASYPSDCTVELLKVIHTDYSDVTPAGDPPTGTKTTVVTPEQPGSTTPPTQTTTYTATGTEGTTVTPPTLQGHTILLVFREGPLIYEVASNPDEAEYTWDGTSLGLSRPTRAGERFKIVHHA